MTTEIARTSVFAHHIIETIGNNGMDYSTLLNHKPLIESYGNINNLAREIHKLITLEIVVTTKIYTPEEGDDFRLSLTKRGIRILKNTNHE